MWGQTDRQADVIFVTDWPLYGAFHGVTKAPGGAGRDPTWWGTGQLLPFVPSDPPLCWAGVSSGCPGPGGQPALVSPGQGMWPRRLPVTGGSVPCRGSGWRPAISTTPCSSQHEVSGGRAPGQLWGRGPAWLWWPPTVAGVPACPVHGSNLVAFWWAACYCSLGPHPLAFILTTALGDGRWGMHLSAQTQGSRPSLLFLPPTGL